MQDWKLLHIEPSMLHRGWEYGIYQSPCEKRIAMVHHDDRDIVLLFQRKPMKILHVDRKSRRTMKAMGISMKQYARDTEESVNATLRVRGEL